MRKYQKIVFSILFCICIIHPNISKADELITACMTGDMHRVRTLLAKSVDINLTDSVQRTPLMWASLYGHDRIVKLLLEKGADIHRVDKNKETAFIFASMDADDIFNWQGKIKTMKLLLEFGADSKTDGLIFLREAAERGYWEIAKSTLEKTKDKDLKKQYLIAAVIGACRSNNIDLAKSLIADVNDINVKLAIDNGDTPLIAAAGSLDLVKLIIEKGGDIHLANNEGITPFMKACSLIKPDLAVIELLLSKGAEVNGRSKDGSTPLMFAIHDYGTDLNLLDFLLKNGADINARNKKNLTALYYAYSGKAVNWDIMKYLLDRGADLNMGNDPGSFFEEMYRSGFKEIFKKLLKYIAGSSRINTDGPVALCYAACAGYAEIIKQLLDNGVNVNARDRNGMSALMHSVLEKRSDIITLLLDNHADIELKDNKGQTALILAARIGSVAAVRLLIDSGADINATDSDGRTALMSGHKRRGGVSLEVMQLLISRGININARDSYGITALSDFSIPDSYEDWQKIILLIENDADINAVDDKNRTILLKAYQHKRLDQIPLILEKGGDAGIKDINRDTVWELAFIERNTKILEPVVTSLKDVNLKGSAGTTLLMYACADGGSLKLVRQILHKGVDINAVNKFGKTALMVAAGKGHTEIVKLLVGAGADINVMNKKGKTAFQIAKSNGHIETAKYISGATSPFNKYIEWKYMIPAVIILLGGIIIVFKKKKSTK